MVAEKPPARRGRPPGSKNKRQVVKAPKVDRKPPTKDVANPGPVPKVQRVAGGAYEYQPTTDHRIFVEVGMLRGRKLNEIARSVGISVPTLKKHFKDEITNGRVRLQMKLDVALFEKAKKGDVSAYKVIMADVAVADAERRLQEYRAGEATQIPRAPKIGKKQQAALDAQTAGIGTDWGDDLLPAAAAKLN